MGERSNTLVKGSGSELYIYGHWTPPDDMREQALAGLRKAVDGGRGDDPIYLGRIVARACIPDEPETTGYGLSSILGDGEVVATIDVDKQTFNDMPYAEALAE